MKICFLALVGHIGSMLLGLHMVLEEFHNYKGHNAL